MQDLLDAFFSATFDPKPIRFTNRDEVGVYPVSRIAERKVPGTVVRLPQPLNRNAFLYGCHALTAGEKVERAIVGFGNWHGSTTKIEAVGQLVGDAGSVNLTPQMLDKLQRWYTEGHRREVLIFHNHPANWANAVLDNEPVASVPDRVLLTKFKTEWTHVAKFLTDGGQLRLYLGENGFVREFTTPPLVSALQLLRKGTEFKAI